MIVAYICIGIVVGVLGCCIALVIYMKGSWDL